MSAVDVGEHGVGTVERNTALSTMTPLQGSSAPGQKTSMASAVVQKKDLRKKATVAEDTVVIVRRGGLRLHGYSILVPQDCHIGGFLQSIFTYSLN